MTEIPVLETERLRLRPYRLDDFDAYAAMWREPVVVRFIGGSPFSREASWARFLRHRGGWQVLGFGFFAIEDRVTGAYVGECGFQDSHRELAPTIEGTMEAGWSLVPARHGKGLASEAMHAALAWAAVAHPDKRITCLIDVDHVVSQRVANKLSFVEFARTTYGGKPVVLFERPRL